MSVKLLYLKLCEKDYMLTTGKMQLNSEEKTEAYTNNPAYREANAVYKFMEKNPGIFGDIISDIKQLDIRALEELVRNNPLKSVKGNVSIDKLITDVENASIRGAKKDLDVALTLAKLKFKTDIIKENENIATSTRESVSKDRKEKAKENIEKNKEELKEIISSLPIGYRTSENCIKTLTNTLSPELQEEMLDFIISSVEEEKKNPHKTQKLSIRERYNQWKEDRKNANIKTQLLEDIFSGDREKLTKGKLTMIGTEDKLEEVRREIIEMRKVTELEKEAIITGIDRREENQEDKSKEETTLIKPKENKFLKFLQDTFDLAGKAGEKIVNGSQMVAENIGNFVNNMGKSQKDKAIKEAEDKLPKDDAKKVEKMYKEPEDKSKEWIVSKEVLEENKAKAKQEKQAQTDKKKSEQKTAHTGQENAGGR